MMVTGTSPINVVTTTSLSVRDHTGRQGEQLLHSHHIHTLSGTHTLAAVLTDAQAFSHSPW